MHVNLALAASARHCRLRRHSEDTVRTHLLDACARLGVHDKAALAARFGLNP